MSVQNNGSSSAIIGKTYSLYGNKNSSDDFYKQLSETADLILEEYKSEPGELLSYITLNTPKRMIKSSEKKDLFFSFMVNILRRDLEKYLFNVEEHLKSITFSQRWDRRLSTSKDQYLLYMLEIELTNRIYLNRFISSSKKLAFLPHCIRDFSRECLSTPDEIDYLCRRCSKICTVNKISQLLKQNNIIPYIWLQADLKKIFKMYIERSETIGVLGIACIPELAYGMRLCQKNNIPVAGIPLDANRCRRWMGEFYENSVNMVQLEKLISGKSTA
jgi:hypothetical protein